MNAPKQELFESIRSVVAGRIRDEMQVRDLAHRASEESTVLRRRIDRAVGYARAGLRLEACAEAEAEPSVFVLAAAFEAEHMRQWKSVCAKNRLPVPEDISAESLGEIEEAIVATEPLRSRLARLRCLVLSDASAWKRLRVLRELVDRDPDNPAWQDDRAALEPAVADELGDRFEASLSEGNLAEAESCVSRLEDGGWRWSGAARIAAQLRVRLDGALAARGTEEASLLVARLEAEWAAENEPGVRGAIEEWRELRQRMLSVGGELPGHLVDRVDGAEAWLAARDADAAARLENRERVAALERLALDERATLLQLRAALRATEQTVEGVPDEVRATAEGRIDALERRSRNRRIAAVVSATLLLGGAAVGTAFVVRRSNAERLAEATAAAIVANVESGRLEEAERQLAEAERDPALAGHSSVGEARSRLASTRAESERRKQQFASLLAQAGDPGSPGARPELVEQAKDVASGAADQRAIVEWERAHARAAADRRGARIGEGVERAKKVVAEVIAAQPTADASWDGRFSSWESALSDVQRQFGEFAEVVSEVRAGRTALATQRAKTDAARAEVGRLDRLASLGDAATSPDALAAALQAYREAHPGSPEDAEFGRALEAKPAWDAVAAWSSVRPRPDASLANQPQSARDAAVSAIDAHLAAHPASPYAAGCARLRPLLAAAPQWRAWLTGKFSTLRPFSLWMIECKDGSRWYSQSDPRKVAFQTDAGKQWKSILVIMGGARRDAYQRFDQAQVKIEGPSPQMAFADRVGGRLVDGEATTNDFIAAFDTIAALRNDDGIDGGFACVLMIGLLETLAPELPNGLGDDLEAAAKRLYREKPSEIDWMDPSDQAARDRSRAARGALRDAVQVDMWRRAYVDSVASACASLGAAYRPCGVAVRAGGKPGILPSGGKPLAAGATLWVVETAKAGSPFGFVRIGSVSASGEPVFESEAVSVPSGTLVFTPEGESRP